MWNIKRYLRRWYFFFLLVSIGLNGIRVSSASEVSRQNVFREPLHTPDTQYFINVDVNTSANRLQGREEIRILNSSVSPLKRLVIDWPYLSLEELKIFVQNKPIQIIAKGTNGLTHTQILIELPQAVESRESILLEIQFGLPLRLGKLNKLAEWHPRLWWGRHTSDDYEVKINGLEEYIVATSGVFDETKNLYSAKGVRKFGVVLMQGLEVLKASSGETEIHCYYEEGARQCAELIHQTAIDVIDFYRDWLGFYPHKILHIVPGGLAHPAGGYPVATAIVGIHGQKQMDKKPESHWQFITAHEIGHQYWMEHVLEAPNTFWLMIGLGVHADRAFMLAKGYGDQHEHDMIQRYIQGTRDQLDTRMNRLPEERKKVDFDYNNVVNHGKGFGVISALACVMGKDTFESAYRRCLKEFKGRNLDVADFQRVCEEQSRERLDWFFDQWIRTSRFLSYEIAAQETSSENGHCETTVKVRRLGTLRMPVPVTALFEDDSRQCLYTDRFLDECSLVFTSKTPLKEVKLDAQGELPLVIPPPDPKIAQLKKDIRNLEFTGEGEKALQLFNKIRNIKLGYYDFPWFRLGLCLYDERHYKEALQAFQNDFDLSSKTTSPYLFVTLVWQGHLLDLMNRRNEALTCYKQALQMKPASWVRHDQWGMKIGRRWIEKRIESPFQRPAPEIIDLKKRIRDLEWTGDGDKALKLFNETNSVKLDDSGFPWGKLGLCLYDGGHYTEALQAFRNDFEQSPTSFSSLVWQGHLLDLMNRREEALRCYKEALEMKPTSWVRHDQYGIKIDFDWIKERLKTPFQRD